MPRTFNWALAQERLPCASKTVCCAVSHAHAQIVKVDKTTHDTHAQMIKCTMVMYACTRREERPAQNLFPILLSDSIFSEPSPSPQSDMWEPSDSSSPGFASFAPASSEPHIATKWVELGICKEDVILWKC